MQLRNLFVLSLTLLTLFNSCSKKDQDTSLPAGPKPVGVPTPVGTPIEEDPVQVTIGTSGGIFVSSDRRLKVVIPAGALSADQQFSVQAVSNHNPLAVGNAYRLQPHNFQFKKPVSIEFSYNDDEIVNTLPEALGIAYQDSAGVWQAQGGATLIKSSRTVKVNTTHFSDWSLFESFLLTPSAAVVHVGGTVQLEVSTTEDLLAPLEEGEELPMGKRITLGAAYVKEWKLAGAGNLNANGGNATYKAPGTVPGSPNPVAVSVSLDLKKRGQFLMICNIEIVEDDGEIEVKLAGSSWVKKTASVAVLMDNGYYAIADSDGDTQGSYVVIMVPNQLGKHPYRSPDSNTGTYVHYLVTNGDNYVCQYMTGDDVLLPSGGGVTITDLGEEDGFIKGTFEVSPAGHGVSLKGQIGMEGKFRVRREGDRR